jgi:hypothetical protein
MKLPRATSDHQRAALKQAVRRQVRAMHGQEAAAAVTRVSPQTLSDYGNARTPRHADVHIPLDVLADLTIDGGPVALVEICRVLGGSFVPLPEPGDGTVWAMEVGEAVRRGGNAAAGLCQALADDGDVSVEEIRDGAILERISEAIDAYARLLRHCQDVIAEETAVEERS